MVKLLVSAAGHDELAKVKGGFPAGYFSVAKSIGITSGVSMAYTGEYFHEFVTVMPKAEEKYNNILKAKEKYELNFELIGTDVLNEKYIIIEK